MSEPMGAVDTWALRGDGKSEVGGRVFSEPSSRFSQSATLVIFMRKFKRAPRNIMRC